MGRNEEDAGLVLWGVTPRISRKGVTFTLHVHVVLTVRTFYYEDPGGRIQAELITSLAHRGNKEQFSKMASAWDVSPFSSCPALMQLICYVNTGNATPGRRSDPE